MSKPPINIDAKQVEAFIRLGSPIGEIAEFFGVTEARIRREFRDLIPHSRAARRIQLRKLQWEAAKAGNVSLLILLGKLELGQREDQPAREEKTILRRRVERAK